MTKLSEGIISGVVLDLIELGQYVNFVETGTYVGDTAEWASSHFENVITIELSERYVEYAKKRLASLANVKILHGDSGELLREIVPSLKGPSIFWLDGHYSFGDTAGQNHECPLLDELRCLRALSGQDVILIDDAHMFLGTPPPPHNPGEWPTFGEALDALRAIDPSFYVNVFENVIVAAPGKLGEALVKRYRKEQCNPSHRMKEGKSHDKLFVEKRLWLPPNPLRLHLGCGETRLEGYVNIDFPQDRHNIIQSSADFFSDIRQLWFEDGVVDEIRLDRTDRHLSA